MPSATRNPFEKGFLDFPKLLITSATRLFITMALNLLITAAEIIGGLLSGSLSLLSDALHNFSDAISIIISYIAIRLAKQPKSAKYTFGLKRAEILAAVINAATLVHIAPGHIGRHNDYRCRHRFDCQYYRYTPA
jgi:Co/Zn/Cd efflux system component